MQTCSTTENFETTCTKLGLVFKTKVELYYFLSVEGIFQIYIREPGSEFGILD